MIATIDGLFCLSITIGVLMYKRIILLVMDSVGIGHAADAAKFW